MQSEECVVRHMPVHDVLSGHIRLLYTGRSTWLAVQAECGDLRQTHAHLIQGTQPSKRLTNIKDIKHYLNIATIARDSVLVTKKPQPLAPD